MRYFLDRMFNQPVQVIKKHAEACQLTLHIVVFLLLFAFACDRKQAQPVPDPDLTDVEHQVAQAITKAREAAVQDPASANSWADLAMSLDAHKFFPEAVACYQEAAVLDPKSYQWPYLAARILREENPQEALDWFRRALKCGGPNIAVPFYYAETLLVNGDLDSARNIFTSMAADPNPSPSFAYFGLGRVDHLSGRLEPARDHLLMAVELNPRHGEAHLLLSELFRRMGDLDRAQLHEWIAANCPRFTPPPDRACADVIKQSKSVKGLILRSILSTSAGDYQQAERLLRQASKLAPLTARGHSLLGAVLNAQNRTDEAMNEFEKALAKNPFFAPALINMAKLFAKTGDFNGAKVHLQTVFENDPAHVEALVFLGQIHLKEGQQQAALELFERAVLASPGDLRALKHLGQSLASAGRIDEALAYWERLCFIDPSETKLALILSSEFSSRGKHSKSIYLLKNALQAKPDDVGLGMNLAWTLATAKDPLLRDGKEAVRLATNAKEKSPASLWAWDVLAAAHAEIGDFPKSVHAAEVALELARKNNNPKTIDSINKRLLLYRTGKPYRQDQ